MKKKIIYDVLSGFPTGMAVGLLCSLFASILIGDGTFYAVVPELAVKMGSELNAVLFQTALCGVLGAIFKGTSVIWELESWSLLKRSGLYFAIGCTAMLLAAYAANWIHPSIQGAAIFIAVFVVVFALIWVVQYLFWKKKVEQINERLKNGGSIP